MMIQAARWTGRSLLTEFDLPPLTFLQNRKNLFSASTVDLLLRVRIASKSTEVSTSGQGSRERRLPIRARSYRLITLCLAPAFVGKLYIGSPYTRPIFLEP
jgi:hypothetical protein